MFWHTDTYNLTLEEPQLKALHGKKLMINVRAGELQICHSEGAPGMELLASYQLESTLRLCVCNMDSLHAI